MASNKEAPGLTGFNRICSNSKPHIIHVVYGKNKLLRIESDPIGGALFQKLARFPEAALHCLVPLAYVVDALDKVLGTPQYIIVSLGVRVL